VAGQINGSILNYEGVGRDAQVPRKSVESYFEILIDTLVGHRLPAYEPGAKVREVAKPKFYWFDPGVARAAARRLDEGLDELSRGAAMETLVYAQLRAWERRNGTDRTIGYYRTGAGPEIDFIVELERKTMHRKAKVACIEVKSSSRWDPKWERPMRELAATGAVTASRLIGVYGGETRLERNGVRVLPYRDFVTALEAGELY
jgi:predicted AAA+ superfamily ATPase